MYRLIVEKCEKPHNFTGRIRYRVISCNMTDIKEAILITQSKSRSTNATRLWMPSNRIYRSGVFINPTKVLKQFLAAKPANTAIN